jgi:hypothetical protein
MAKGMRQHLVDTYKYVFLFMEVRERAAFKNRLFFVGNDVSEREEDLMPDEGSDLMWVE